MEEATDDSNANSTLNGVIYKNEAQVEATHADGEAYAGKYDVKVKTGTLILTKKISKKISERVRVIRSLHLRSPIRRQAMFIIRR